jgi:hypothetical protein
MSPAPKPVEFQSSKDKHPPQIDVYNYTADEISGYTELYSTMKQWAQNMHAAGVKNLVTMAPVKELFDDGSGTGRSAVDIWTILPDQYDNNLDLVKEAIAKGDEVWSYNTLVQDSYSPKWAIDFTPIDFRIQPGFISQSLGLTGVLYWKVDNWTDDPWNEIAPDVSAALSPGDGMLMYPNKQVGTQGAVASMRMKWLRKGVEDYEYVQILKERGLGNKALSITRSVARDWKNWTRDPKALENARYHLAQEIIKSNRRTS